MRSARSFSTNNATVTLTLTDGSTGKISRNGDWIYHMGRDPWVTTGLQLIRNYLECTNVYILNDGSSVPRDMVASISKPSLTPVSFILRDIGIWTTKWIEVAK